MSLRVEFSSGDSKSDFPSDISSKRDETTREQFSNHLRKHIVTKGGHELVQIDLNEIDPVIARFREIPDELIRTLSGEDAEKFKEMVHYAGILHGSKSYDTFLERINAQFANLKEVKPGTVGAYFHGCFVETTFSKSHPGCSVTCAGSMPPSKTDKHFSHCSNTVVSAKYSKGSYHFNVLNKASNVGNRNKRHLAFLYVPYTSIHRCPGFSKNEIKQLQAMNIKEVRLVGYKNNGTKYYDLAPKPIKVTKLKSRLTEVKPKTNEHSHKTKDNQLWVSLIVTIIIIIVLTLWYLQKKH